LDPGSLLSRFEFGNFRSVRLTLRLKSELYIANSDQVFAAEVGLNHPLAVYKKAIGRFMILNPEARALTVNSGVLARAPFVVEYNIAVFPTSEGRLWLDQVDPLHIGRTGSER
jgi:hypothetical protein